MALIDLTPVIERLDAVNAQLHQTNEQFKLVIELLTQQNLKVDWSNALAERQVKALETLAHSK
jgi:hypothetical protein